MRGDTATTTVAIIQARVGSTRLPAKVLMDIEGRSMLARVVERVRLIPGLDNVVVATTTNAADEAVVRECVRLDVPVFRGSEDDVLDRYYRVAMEHGADVVLRVTSDCPLLDPDVSGRVLQEFMDRRPDYASNTLRRTYPRGLDTEVMSMETLARAWREAAEPYQREHVTPFIYEHPERFALLSVENEEPPPCGDCRWTVDTVDDLAFARAVYSRLKPRTCFGWREVWGLLRSYPEIAHINQHVRQKELKHGYEVPSKTAAGREKAVGSLPRVGS